MTPRPTRHKLSAYQRRLLEALPDCEADAETAPKFGVHARSLENLKVKCRELGLAIIRRKAFSRKPGTTGRDGFVVWWRECPTCHGTGEVDKYRDLHTSEPCPECAKP